METNKTQRAGDLAIKILLKLPEEIPDHSGDERDKDHQTTPDKEVYQLPLFLLAIENLRASEVPLKDAPISKAFDDKVQKLSDNLNPRMTEALETPEGMGEQREQRRGAPSQGRSLSPEDTQRKARQPSKRLRSRSPQGSKEESEMDSHKS
jgi:hypothetical protein